MNESTSIGETALMRPGYGGSGNFKARSEHAKTLDRKWINLTKASIKGALVDVQILVTSLMPIDFPRLYFMMARTIPYGVLCTGPKIPAIFKPLDNMIMLTVTNNPPEHLAEVMRIYNRDQQHQGFTVTGLVVLAWIMEHLGVNNNCIARNETIHVRLDGDPNCDDMLRELIKVNSYLCDSNSDVARTNKLCGQVNQILMLHGRQSNESRFQQAFKTFSEDYENESISELSKRQDSHAQLYIWKTEARKHGQESVETVKEVEHPHLQSRIPTIKDSDKLFKWSDEDHKYGARADADAKYILHLLHKPKTRILVVVGLEHRPEKRLRLAKVS